MSQWFYADDNRERHGPLPAENIVELFRSGRISADTLVWREGAGDWQPLRDFAAELGLDPVAPAAAAPAAPPVPPSVPHAQASASASPAPVAKRGLSGCAITAIIAAIVGMVLLAILAILAAIALPAYQQYTLRSKITMAHAHLVPLKQKVSAFVQANGRCPGNDDLGFGSPEGLSGPGISEVRIGQLENGHCGIDASLHMPQHAVLDGQSLWLDYDNDTGEWQCASDVADKYLPISCRTP